MALCELWSATQAKLPRAGGIGERQSLKPAKLLGRSDVEMGWIVDLAARNGNPPGRCQTLTARAQDPSPT
ncbi:MAG: hypothetical protein ACP5P1_14600 [Acidimicrobiales bacterium]